MSDNNVFETGAMEEYAVASINEASNRETGNELLIENVSHDGSGKTAISTAKRNKPIKQNISVGAILLLLYGLIGIVDEIYNLSTYGWSTAKDLYDIIAIASVIFFGTVILLGKKGNIVVVGACLFCVPLAWNLVTAIPYIAYLGILTWISYILNVASAVLLVIIAISPNRSFSRKIWFLPGILMGVCFLRSCYTSFVYTYDNITTFEIVAMTVIDLLDVLIWLLVPNNLVAINKANEDPVYQYSVNEAGEKVMVAVSYGEQDENYINMFSHVLLLIFTCGIWNLIWIYKTTKYLNNVPGEEERNPVNKLLLCIFVPFYSIYWVYKSAQRIDKYANMNGIQSDITTLSLVLAIFVGIVPPMIMQDKINALVLKKNQADVKLPKETTYCTASSTLSELDTIAILKSYKELLDIGAITQEEYEEKKKALLR